MPVDQQTVTVTRGRTTCAHVEIRSHCPVCASPASRVLYECPFTRPPISTYIERYYDAIGRAELNHLQDATYRVLDCGRCGLVYQQEIPDPFLMDRLYEHWIDPELALDRDCRRRGVNECSMYAQEIMQLVACVGEPARVLDFGMGWGHWARMAQSLGCETWGLELSPRRIEHARSLGLRVLDPDALDGQRFDLINAEQVVEHLADPLAAMQRLAQTLRPGGLLKVCVPNGRTIHRRLRRLDWDAPRDTRWSLHAVTPLEHINCFDHRALVTLGRRAGLEPSRVPMMIQYACSTHWRGLGRIARNLAYPIYRNVLSQGTWMVFRRTD